MLRSIALALVLLTSVYSGFSQSYWKIRTEYGEDVLLTIEMHAADHTFKAFTRKDALKDIAGFFTYNLARAAGKLKYPEIVYIEGKTEMQKDKRYFGCIAVVAGKIRLIDNIEIELV